MKLYFTDVLVRFHQACLHLTHANRRYIALLADSTVTMIQKRSSRAHYHEHEIKALEALVGALSADAPASQLPHGPGRHVPSLLLRGNILLQVLARNSTATIAHLARHHQLLHLPSPPLWISGRSGLQDVVGQRQQGFEDGVDEDKRYKREGRMEEQKPAEAETTHSSKRTHSTGIEEQILAEAERCFRTAVSCEADNSEALLAWATVLQVCQQVSFAPL
jgi:hypothetical protein